MSKPPSFKPRRPRSNVEDCDQNQTPHVKPPSHSKLVRSRPDSSKEDQHRQQVAEKSAPTLAEMRPGKVSYQEGDGTRGGVAVNQDGAKTPSFKDVAPGIGKSEHDVGHKERKEKLPSQSDVRTPNQNDSSGHQGHPAQKRRRPLSYNSTHYEKHN